MSLTPEQEARQQIDRMLAEAGWLVQDVKSVNLHAGRGVAICEFHILSIYKKSKIIKSSTSTKMQGSRNYCCYFLSNYAMQAST